VPRDLEQHLEDLFPEADAHLRETRSSKWVETFLPIACRNPFPGMTGETLAAALASWVYRHDSHRYAETMEPLERGEKALADRYAGRVLLELLQNAEDAYREVDRSGRAKLRAERREGRTWVTFEHEGKPFDARDLDAFRRMHGSAKTEQSGRLGRFGVGIKSVLAVADMVELHSGPFHLSFARRSGQMDLETPLFMLPWPCEAPAGGLPQVSLALRWIDESVSAETALHELLGRFVPSHLAFLERLHGLDVQGIGSYSLEPDGSVGAFERFRILQSTDDSESPLSQEPDVLLRLWESPGGGNEDDQVALALLAREEAEGLTLRGATPPPRMRAYFPIGNVPLGAGILVHAPFELVDDRESLNLALQAKRERNASLLERLAKLIARAVKQLDTPAFVADDLPRILLGAPSLDEPLAVFTNNENKTARALANGMHPSDTLRVLTTMQLRKARIFAVTPARSRATPLRRGRDLLFGGNRRELWSHAFPGHKALPSKACASWLRGAPIEFFEAEVAGVDRARDLLARVSRASAEIDGIRPMRRDDGCTTARLRLIAQLSRDYPTDFAQRLGPIPLPVIGEATQEVFLQPEPESGLTWARALGLAVVDWAPWVELSTEDRKELVALLSEQTEKMKPRAVLEAVDRIRREGQEPKRDTAILRATAWALADMEPERASAPEDAAEGSPLARAWSMLFRAQFAWGAWPDRDRRATMAIWCSRVRVPTREGSWIPVVDTSVGRGDLPATLKADVGRIARLLGVDAAGARAFLRRCGAWDGVPIRLRFYLPWKGERGAEEWAEFQGEVPDQVWDVTCDTTPYNHALYGFTRKARDHRLPPDRPGMKRRSDPGGWIPSCGGFLSFNSNWRIPRPLAHAELPLGIDDPSARRLLADGQWLPFSHVPLHQAWSEVRYKNQCMSPRGFFPTLLMQQLRGRPLLPRHQPPPKKGEALPEVQLVPARGLFRWAGLPSGRPQWESSRARFLPMVPQEEVEALSADALDLLHVAPIFNERHDDLRHVVQALLMLRDSVPLEDGQPLGSRRNALLSAHTRLWEAIARVLDRDTDWAPREQLDEICADASRLGWLSIELPDSSGLPVLASTGEGFQWWTLGRCRDEDPRQCAFYNSEPVGHFRAIFGSQVRFVELPRVPVRLVRALGIPVFQPDTPRYRLTPEDPDGVCPWLARLLAQLVPYIEAKVTSDPASGGRVAMDSGDFVERAGNAGLFQPRFQRVKHWPSVVHLKEPNGAVLDLPAEHEEYFRFVPELRGRACFLVHEGRVPDRGAAQDHLWRLDMPIARALQSPGHAPFIQNLLRAVDANNIEDLASDPGLQALFGGQPPAGADDDERHEEPPLIGTADFLERVFQHRDVRAAAIVLANDDPDEARLDSTRPWRLTAPMRRLADHDAESPYDALSQVLGIPLDPAVVVDVRSTQLAIVSAGRDLPGFGDVLTQIRRRNRIQFGGRIYESMELALDVLGPMVDDLPLPDAAKFTGEPAGESQGRGPAGRGAGFAGKNTLVGNLGERYAARWLQHRSPADPALVIDVTTQETRDRAVLPAGYDKPGDDRWPGVDFLVFEDGPDQLPTGWEVKSRLGDGPVRFRWTRNEAAACRRAVQGRQEFWPLGGYRVLVVSNLDPSTGNGPTVCVIEGVDCLDVADPTGYVVLAKPR